MLTIKKYTDGRFFETASKKFLKPEQLAELIRKGEAMTVVLTKTGKDITQAVIKEFTGRTGTAKEKKEMKDDTRDKEKDEIKDKDKKKDKDHKDKNKDKDKEKDKDKDKDKKKDKDGKSRRQDHPFLNTEGLKKWVSEAIDKSLGKVIDAVNLPTKDQVAKLDESIRELNRKIEALEGKAAKAAPRKAASPARKKDSGKTPAQAKEESAPAPGDTVPGAGDASSQE
jgi:hypothetical protein